MMRRVKSLFRRPQPAIATITRWSAKAALPPPLPAECAWDDDSWMADSHILVLVDVDG